MIQEILTTDMAGAARWERGGCATEDIATSVAQARAAGHILTPDAADSCIAAMTRQAHDGALTSLYADTLNLKVGSYQGAAELPQRILVAIQNGTNLVDLGQGEKLTVTPGLALDDGFTLAYLAGRQAQQISADPQKVKAVTEGCVAQQNPPKQCFGAGYVQGAAAFAAAQTTLR